MNKRRISLLILCVVSISLLSGATFTEASLKGLLLSNNLQLKRAIDDQDLSVLDRKDAKAGYGPTIELEISATYLQNTTLFTIQENPVDPTVFPLPPTMFPLELKVEPTLYKFALTLSQPVWTWGKLRNGVAMTEKLVEIRQRQRFALQKSLLAELESRLYAQHYLGTMEELLRQQLLHAEAMVSLVREAFANGMALQEDVLSSQVFARQLKLAAVQVSQQRQKQQSSIGRLCNTDILSSDQILWTPDEEHFRSMLGFDLKRLQAMATAKNQEQVRIATLMGELAALSTSLAQGDLYWKPNMAMQVSLEYGGAKFPFIEDGWMEKDDYTFNVSVGMKTTIWDGGRKFHEVRRSSIKEGQAALDIDQVYQGLKAQVEEAYHAMHLAHENLEYLHLKEASAKAQEAQQQKLFDSGYGSEQDLLKAKLALLSVRFEQEQQWLSYTGAFAALNALCGVENPLL
ncbi:MAG: TolC family protein [Sphaerochaeta sp.]|nr:TolC family protein [Sphaerochaeta sp.]